MYGQALMAGTQMIVESPQADKIINAATFVQIIKIFKINIIKNNKIIKINRSYAATFVVRRARYERGRVTEKYLDLKHSVLEPDKKFSQQFRSLFCHFVSVLTFDTLGKDRQNKSGS